MRTYISIDEIDAPFVHGLYDKFNAPVAALDCGKKCAPHNPGGKPFCCDICHAVPAVYKGEWKYLKPNTDLWRKYRGNECVEEAEAGQLASETPDSMVLLACLGPARCERDFRALSCRQFPFFPYVTSDYRFLGLVYEWEFIDRCWVMSNLSKVTKKYRDEFIETFDKLFSLFQDEFDNYAYHSEKLRLHYAEAGRRFPLLHRNGGAYLVSPRSERMTRVDVGSLPKFGVYK